MVSFWDEFLNLLPELVRAEEQGEIWHLRSTNSGRFLPTL